LKGEEDEAMQNTKYNWHLAELKGSLSFLYNRELVSCNSREEGYKDVDD